uniref:Uncharacterized protein n=1 Tax=Oryza punctata TaxID=4537 RepID=A0A0E0K9G2_ORYPU
MATLSSQGGAAREGATGELRPRRRVQQLSAEFTLAPIATGASWHHEPVRMNPSTQEGRKIIKLP